MLNDAWLGRSHRAAGGKAKLKEVIDRSRRLIGLPDDWLLAIVPASDTGAVELALWSLLGARGVDVLVWESFGKGWATDIQQQLKLPDVRVLDAGYGELPDLSAVDPARDVVFTWNGTTSGVRVPDADWISAEREGLAICDATSAAFAMNLPFDKLDVVTWSWQKCLGGEGAHGMLALGPRAQERLRSYTPDRPLPKIFRLMKGDDLNSSIFTGATINTPSMLCVEDALDGLKWAESIGGLEELIRRADANTAAITGWAETQDWISNLAVEPDTASTTSVCLKITAPAFTTLPADEQKSRLKTMCGLLEAEGVAFDINGYRDAPPSLRIWCGPTVETDGITALLPWLEWAWRTINNDLT